MTAVSETEKTNRAATELREITVAHSPDSDDAFMFYAWPRIKSETRASVLPTRSAISRR